MVNENDWPNTILGTNDNHNKTGIWDEFFGRQEYF